MSKEKFSRGNMRPARGPAAGASQSFSKGFVTSLSPRELPLDASPDTINLMVEKGGLRRAFAQEAVGANAPEAIVAVGSYQQSAYPPSALYRIAQSTTAITLQTWDGSTWTTEDTLTGVTSTPPTFAQSFTTQDKIVFFPRGQREALYWDSASGITEIATATFRPYPRFGVAFGDRLLLFCDESASPTDYQYVAVSVDGDITDFEGTGSDELILIDTRSHPVDAIQGAAPVGSNSLALFRQRSIMRGFETGQVAPPIGFRHWVEGLGTEAPFSITITSAGVMFLGHDKMPYLISENELTPVGKNVKPFLNEVLGDDLVDTVTATYDAALQHWWLLIRDYYILIFDLGHFISTGEERWTVRDATGVENLGYSEAEI